MTRDELILKALAARTHAYAPYSKFAVGAALRTTTGEAFAGCNVENISFGLTMCAERVAIGTALACGARSFDMIALASDSEEPVMPCGACRQVMAEFSPALRVVSSTTGGKIIECDLGTLLPNPRQGILS